MHSLMEVSERYTKNPTLIGPIPWETVRKEDERLSDRPRAGSHN